MSLRRQLPSRDYGQTDSGTQVIIYGGRNNFSWDKRKIEELKRSVTQLNSPNPSPYARQVPFAARLSVPQIPNLKNDPLTPPLANFEFTGLVDEDGLLDYTLKFEPPKSIAMPAETIKREENLKAANPTYWKTKGEGHTKCGPFFFNIKAWYRKKPWVTDQQFLTQLTEYGGISIYRDGINILPAEWGSQNDWLGLSKEHIKQGWRISYYNMLGNIEIDQRLNVSLTDKTNREGLIENKAYDDFVQLMRAAIKVVLENAWAEKRNEYTALDSEIVSDPKKLRDYANQSIEIHKNIELNYPVEKDPFSILTPLGAEKNLRRERLVDLTRSLKDLKKSLEMINEAHEMLTEQAGYGLGIASSVHEIAKITSNFYYGINEVLKQDNVDKEKLKELLDSSSSLQTELKRLSPIRAVRGENRKEFNILRPIRYAISLHKSKLAEDGIDIELKAGKGFKIYARYGAIIQIFSNLIVNAQYWVASEKRELKKVIIDVDEDYKVVTIADSGPGINPTILPHLFKPGFSMKLPKSGLGLHISRHYMQEMGGNLQLLSNPKFRIDGLEGAQFLLDYSNVKVSK